MDIDLSIALMTPWQRVLLRLKLDEKFQAQFMKTMKNLRRKFLIEMRLGRMESEYSVEEIDNELGWT